MFGNDDENNGRVPLTERTRLMVEKVKESSRKQEEAETRQAEEAARKQADLSKEERINKEVERLRKKQEAEDVKEEARQRLAAEEKAKEPPPPKPTRLERISKHFQKADIQIQKTLVGQKQHRVQFQRQGNFTRRSSASFNRIPQVKVIKKPSQATTHQFGFNVQPLPKNQPQPRRSLSVDFSQNKKSFRDDFATLPRPVQKAPDVQKPQQRKVPFW